MPFFQLTLPWKKSQKFGCEVVNDLKKPEVSLINQSESIQIVDRPRAKHRFKYGTLEGWYGFPMSYRIPR